MLKQIKDLGKRFIDYTIERDRRIYRLRHTPFCLRLSLVRRFEKRYGALPVCPRKVVIDNYMGNGYGCNGKYVTERLLSRRADLDIVWVVREKEAMWEQFPPGVRLVEYDTKEALYEYATAAVWLCNYHLVKYLNRGLQKKEGQAYIQMWHGSFGIKKIEQDCGILTEMKSWNYLAQKNAALTDYWISNSRFETEIYRSAFWGAGEILEYGHPRNDIFFCADKEDLRRGTKEALALKAEARVVLYVPTFRERGASSAGKLPVGELLHALQEKWGYDYRFVVRFHPRMAQNERASLLEKWQDVPVTDATGYPDIQELLLCADLVITDYSSCIFDFMLTGRPGFLFVPDRDSYGEERGFYYPLEQAPFPVAQTKEALIEQIRCFDTDLYQKSVAAFLKQKGSKEDGQASERVARLVQELCGKVIED